MIKLIAFDLDLTLAPVGGPTEYENVLRIRRLEKEGIRIAVCSGKSTYYLSGFLRQFGLKNPVMVGENGCVIHFGADLPPEYYNVIPITENAFNALRKIRSFIEKTYPDIWFQPNITAVTPFPTSAEQFDTINAFLEENKNEFCDIDVYRHFDSFDILPHGISKKTGLAAVCERLKIGADEVITMGDGTNDYSMFEFSKYSIGINLADSTRATVNVKNLSEALDFAQAVINRDKAK